MAIYIFNYFLIILFSFKSKFNAQVVNTGKILFITYLIWFIGFRYKVGGDWYAYLKHYQYLSNSNILLQLFAWDPAYVAVEYISKFLGLGIWGINSICAIIFLASFLYFIKVFNLKFGYSFLIAYPYLIMVVVNGYVRQGVAIGLVMAFCALLYKNKILKSFYVLVAATLFHKTAIIAGILVILYKRKFTINFFIYFIFLIVISIVLYITFHSSLDIFVAYYFEKQMQSSGGLIRVLVNILATILLFIHAKKYRKYFDDYNLWKIFGYFSFLMLFIALYFKATTIADRLLLYFYPLQIVIFQRILVLIKDKNLKYIYFLSLLLLFGVMLTIWLLFATHNFAWIPYGNYFFKK